LTLIDFLGSQAQEAPSSQEREEAPSQARQAKG